MLVTTHVPAYDPRVRGKTQVPIEYPQVRGKTQVPIEYKHKISTSTPRLWNAGAYERRAPPLSSATATLLPHTQLQPAVAALNI